MKYINVLLIFLLGNCTTQFIKSMNMDIEYRVASNTGKKIEQKNQFEGEYENEEMQDDHCPKWSTALNLHKEPIFVVTDGHGFHGRKIAKKSAKYLHKELKNKKYSNKTFCDAFENVDKEVQEIMSGKYESVEVERSGATAVALTLDHHYAHIAWVGDSVCYVVKKITIENKYKTEQAEKIIRYETEWAEKITKDHDVHNFDEVTRVGKDKVTETEVCGAIQCRLKKSRLEVTRAFGDKLGKDHDNMIVKPDYKKLPLVSHEERSDERVISNTRCELIAFALLTDGVSNYIKADDIRDIITKHSSSTASRSIIALAALNCAKRHIDAIDYLPEINELKTKVEKLHTIIKDQIQKIKEEQNSKDLEEILESFKNKAPDNQTVAVIKLRKEKKKKLVNETEELHNNAH